MANAEMDKIIREYKEGKISLEECNELLKPYGFHLNPLAEGESAGWTKEEMEEGFIEPSEPAEPLEKNHLARRTDRKNEKGVKVKSKRGVFLVDYDELGYAVSATPYIPADQRG